MTENLKGNIDINLESVFLIGSCCYFSGGVSLYSLGGKSASSVGRGSDFHNSGVNCAADTVLHFKVQLGDDVELESSVFLEILL